MGHREDLLGGEGAVAIEFVEEGRRLCFLGKGFLIGLHSDEHLRPIQRSAHRLHHHGCCSRVVFVFFFVVFRSVQLNPPGVLQQGGRRADCQPRESHVIPLYNVTWELPINKNSNILDPQKEI